MDTTNENVDLTNQILYCSLSELLGDNQIKNSLVSTDYHFRFFPCPVNKIVPGERGRAVYKYYPHTYIKINFRRNIKLKNPTKNIKEK